MGEIAERIRRERRARERATAKGIQLGGIGVIAAHPRTEEKK